MVWIKSKMVVSFFILDMYLVVVAQCLFLLDVAHSITQVLNGL